jgi:hypothetical protein
VFILIFTTLVVARRATLTATRTLEQQLEKHAAPPSTADAAAEDRRRTCRQVAAILSFFHSPGTYHIVIHFLTILSFFHSPGTSAPDRRCHIFLDLEKHLASQ